MKKILFALVAMMATSTVSFAQSFNYGNNRRNTTSTYGSYGTNSNTTTVNGYTSSNGTYVNGYTRTQKNNTNHDNFSTSGNYNPYTGTTGSRARDYSNQSYNELSYPNGNIQPQLCFSILSECAPISNDNTG